MRFLDLVSYLFSGLKTSLHRHVIWLSLVYWQSFCQLLQIYDLCTDCKANRGLLSCVKLWEKSNKQIKLLPFRVTHNKERPYSFSNSVCKVRLGDANWEGQAPEESMGRNDKNSVTKNKYLTLDHSLILPLGIDAPTDSPENDGSGAVSYHITNLFSTWIKF